MAAPNWQLTLSAFDERAGQPLPPPHVLTSTEGIRKLSSDPLDVLYNFAGYVPPIHVLQNPTNPNSTPPPYFYNSIGLKAPEGHDDLFSSGLGTSIVQFFNALINQQRPSSVHWDLCSTNRTSLTRLWRLRDLRKVDDLYLFDFGSTSTVPWKVAVTNPADALMVVRLHPKISDYDIARYLLFRGVRLHTLLPLHDIPHNLAPPLTIPVRPADYTFTRDDYDQYVQQRNLILQGARRRAALLRGGIVWRIAIDSGSLFEALQGPSEDGLINYGRVQLPSSGCSGSSLYDNELNREELGLICGLYECRTGHGEQVSHRSWWPLYSSFENISTGENYGRWTEMNEDEYQKRLREIEQGAEPFTANQWRNRLRGRKETRDLKKAVAQFSADFLDSWFTRGSGL